jgi:biotin operon repressor
MADADIRNTQIAEVFDISDERVRQVIGNRGKYNLVDNPDVISRVMAELETTELSNDALGEELNISGTIVRKVAIAQLGKRGYEQVLRQRRHRRLVTQLKAFATSLNGSNVHPGDVMSYNYALHHHLSVLSNDESVALCAEAGFAYIPGKKWRQKRTKAGKQDVK